MAKRDHYVTKVIEIPEDYKDLQQMIRNVIPAGHYVVSIASDWREDASYLIVLMLPEGE
jgi:hypothetical protein